ncbi:MAG: EFR1 family ferrodoxin [Spirochaetales bacterium]|nr:EFR1 family ferrodoxin [Spirochaetales bacterium]
MNKIEIYYFSGSGNSLKVARDLAEKLKGKLISVASVMNRERITTDADIIGFVFPLYDFKPPLTIMDVVPKFKKIDTKYIFAVCTYGLAPSHSLKHLNKIIQSCGGCLSAGFAVRMPHNGIGSIKNNDKKNQSMYEAWKNKLETISSYIKAGKTGRIEASSPVFSFLNPRALKRLPSAIKFIMHLLLKGIKSLDFTSDEKCNGCGICEKICQAKNITMVDNKPKWAKNCLGCFACLHWCPKQAISLGGYNMDIAFYHHPDVKLSDMVR